MSLNKVKGNMYSFCTHTWNTIKGACPHDCAYCYMKKWGGLPLLHFDEKELNTDLGEGNFIFVGSSCDMWAQDIAVKWILKTLEHCRKYNNKYLFQSKYPGRIYRMRNLLPSNVILGTTIETNRSYPEMGDAPDVKNRAWTMFNLQICNFQTIITIEPIMDFDLDELIKMILVCTPTWVNIGANTNSKVKLPEPPPEKIKALIGELRLITEVKVKDNLKRLI